MLECLELIPTEQTDGLIGAAKSCFLAKIKPDLIITSSTEQAQKLKDELKFITSEETYLFPAPDMASAKDAAGERLKIVKLLSDQKKATIVAPARAALSKTSRTIESLPFLLGKKVKRDEVIEKLADFGYKRQLIVGERGEFSVKGGLIDIYADIPIRVELVGDEVGALREFDPIDQRSRRKLDSIEVLPLFEKEEVAIFELLAPEAKIVLDEPVSVRAAAEERYGELEKASTLEVSSLLSAREKTLYLPPPHYFKDIDALRRDLAENPSRRTVIVSRHASRLEGLRVIEGDLSGGFFYEPGNFLLLTDREIFGEEYRPKKVKTVSREGIDEALLVDLKEGDHVVHENYGVGIFRGMRKMPDVEGEHMLIEYAKGDRLYVPLTMMGLVEKYSSGGDYVPKLSRLGGAEWIKTKNKVKKSVRDMTKELLELYAARKKMSGIAFARDDALERELEDTFPYEETPDQLKAIEKVRQDMETPLPMDRLICGDVGYGKTEVAIRAAAKACASGKQTAVLVPTTILAEQHYLNFSERFRALPYKVEMLSRFRSKEEQKKVLEGLQAGAVDVVIGTHRLLSRDIKFRDLGLLIIDEEHRFGVAHKEKLKKLRQSVDALTLTATPIPRTLYFSLSGARDLSIINTPPLDRSPVRTYILPWEDQKVREAILRELDRGGQVYFVYNKVETIEGMLSKLRKLVPEARFGIGHGQMRERELEETMTRFINHEFDVLLCSTIIESGLDIVNVNTIIIDEADRFGLSQLYQLRGRVGRGPTRAYAYLLYHQEKVMTSTALERLQAIQEFSALGSGYKLAMRDLEIRGAGNLLGAEQSGHVMSVGFDLYCELLEEAVRELKGIPEPTPRQVEIDLKIEAYIPDDYIEDDRQRIAIYRRINLIETEAKLKELKEELADRFGRVPDPLNVLFEIISVKLVARDSGVRSVKQKGDQVRIEYFNGNAKTVSVKKIGELKARIGK